MGLRLAEGIEPARYTALSGRTLDPKRIAILREEGAVETTTDGRLRVTLSRLSGPRRGGRRSRGVAV